LRNVEASCHKHFV